MPPWLQQSFQNPTSATIPQLVWRTVAAFVLGCVVAGIYKLTHRDEPTPPSFPRTLVLLAILISMVTEVIGSNAARAFSIAGVLAIIRFRTVVRDTQDTAFVIFAVIAGMAAGADQLWLAVIGSSVIGFAIFLLRPRRRGMGWLENECDLSLRVPAEANPEELLADVFEKHIQTFEVRSLGTAQKGASLEVNYRLRLRDGTRPFDLVSALNRIEGIQSVELSKAEDG
jgi:hypothetical protein